MTAAQTAAAPPATASRSRINVVLFSGGSGTQSITEALLRHPQISLKILINAYDDGHSTGRLRRFIPGMLGPSDVRKNLNRLMPVGERSQQALKTISDYRLAVGISRDSALETVHAMLGGRYSELPAKLSAAFNHLMVGQLREVSAFLDTFLVYEERERDQGRNFDFTDCAIGNLLFAGCYLSEGRDFNRTIEAFSRFHEVDPGILLNITLGENLFLVAEKESGAILFNEADIVASQDTAKISLLHLLDERTYRSSVETGLEALRRMAGPVPQYERGAAPESRRGRRARRRRRHHLRAGNAAFEPLSVVHDRRCSRSDCCQQDRR